MSIYHRQTAYRREAMSGHAMDWANQPAPYKNYQGLEPRPLAGPRYSDAGFFDLALSWPPPAASQPQGVDGERLAAALLLAGGVTEVRRMGGESFDFRSPASAGALYPFELYPALQGLADPPDGLYHFAPQAPGLHALSEGSWAASLAPALLEPPSRLTFLISAIFWRSVWKYRSRAYRYCLLDAGHMLANLELALASVGWNPETQFDFRDDDLNRLLGLDPQQEVVLAVVRAGGAPGDDPGQPAAQPPTWSPLPLSPRPEREAMVLAAHQAGVTDKPTPPPDPEPIPDPDDALILPRPLGGGPNLAKVIQARRSRRNFIPQALSQKQISALLAAALPQAGNLGAQVILLSGPQIEHMTWRYHPRLHALEPRDASPQAHLHAARACLEQMWVGQAAMIMVLWAPLAELEAGRGPRAYRHAMLEAGRCGQRLYLAATALGLGCCGVGAFYDDELAQAFNLPGDVQPLYLLAAGPIKGGLR